MEQIYFLSVFGNILAGLVLIAEHLGKKMPLLKQLDNFFKNIGARFVLAAAVVIIALIKLVWPFNGIPILGDLFPMTAGLFAGFTLIFDYLRGHSDVETKTLVTLDKIFIANKFLIGIGVIVIAFLHFLLMGIVLF
jgi:hypothetical protein